MGRFFNFDILSMLLTLPGIIIGLSFHEFAHAYAAVKLGDDTPKYQGRLTLDPFKHLDPVGFICLLFFRFGWAKPVMINPRNFKNTRRDDTIVSLAGPLMNLVVAIISLIIMRILMSVNPYMFLQNGYVLTIIQYIAYINIVLMVFNLIPIPPLDGHHILANIGGFKVANFYNKYYQQIRIVLLLLIFTGIIGRIISPIVDFIFGLLFNLVFLF